MYPVKLLNLPTVVEAYKTYDDINLVKINDVGQVGTYQHCSAVQRLTVSRMPAA